LPGADADVLGNLVEFSTHWLGAGRVGAAIVWRLDGDARELGGLGFGSAVQIPPLDLADRTHFVPLLNALSQYDRARSSTATGASRPSGCIFGLRNDRAATSDRSAGLATRRHSGSPPTCRARSCSWFRRAAH
jgi:hypothetical protein